MAVKPRQIIRIQLTPAAKRKLDSATDALGMTNVATMSRLVEWFADQPEMIQAAVVGSFPDAIRSDVAAMILRRMSDVA